MEGVHEGKKPFKCNLCEKKFIGNCDLVRITTAVHKGKKPFKCDHCCEESVRNFYLDGHTTTIHEGKKPFKCNICNENFDRICDLHGHTAAVYEGKKPFKCHIENDLRVLAINICGIECYERLDQIGILLLKHLVSVAVLTVTETSLSIAETSNIEGFKAFFHQHLLLDPQVKKLASL